MSQSNDPEPSKAPAEAPMPNDPKQTPPPQESPQPSDPDVRPVTPEVPEPDTTPEDSEFDPFDEGNFPV